MLKDNVKYLYPKSNPNTVAQLEQLLERARAGEVKGCAVVALLEDNYILDGYFGIENAPLTVIGGLRLVEQRIMFGRIEIPEVDLLIE